MSTSRRPPARAPAEIVTSGFLVISAILSWIAFFTVGFGDDAAERVPVLNWFTSGTLSVDWAFRIDTLTVVMLVVVTTVSSLVHIYSIGYMAHDPYRPRFFAYLSLFTFAMLALVTADNLVQLFFGWEGVGLASYLLIGFWYKRPVRQRRGDQGVHRQPRRRLRLRARHLRGLRPVQLGRVTRRSSPMRRASSAQTIHFLSWDLDALTVVCLLLFMGAMGKSAQFLLHTWLPDAMEGPTPVSALIHAATMVTAGVFMVARLSPLFELSRRRRSTVVIFIGATTAFFAATVGLVQNDIKRVIAYSTCSQLGYMFVAMGVGAYQVGMFHLFTHAFFKALLFLGAGSVIHAVSGEQDMRKMGGLRTHIPVTYWMMVIGTLALTGFPLTAGYFSKDAIIEAAFVGDNPVAGYGFVLTVDRGADDLLLLLAADLPDLPRRARAPAEVMKHVHESPQVMLVPLYVLAAGALLAGIIFHGAFVGDEQRASSGRAIGRWPAKHVLEEMHHAPLWVVAICRRWSWLIGFAVAVWFYIVDPTRAAPARRAARLALPVPAQQVVLRRALRLPLRPPGHSGSAASCGRRATAGLIDGFGPDGVSARVLDVTQRVVRLQSGYLYHYAFAMLIGVAALVTWLMFAG